MLRPMPAVLAVASFLSTLPAHAEEALDQVASRPDVAGRGVASALPDVVVTANRTAQPVERVGASVTVLTTPVIEQRQSVSMLDLLATTPGVSFTRNGPVGTAAGLYLRGSNSHHTLVLIDGVKVNDPALTQGYYNFGNLLVGDTARIEVLRGAQSTLWGSQAVGGVVNILTGEATRPFEASFGAEAGSFGTRYVRSGIGGASERLTWRLAASRYDTDGYSAMADQPENDGFGSTGLSGRMNLKLTEALSVDLRSVWSDSKGAFDAWNGDSRDYGRTQERVLYAGLNLDVLDGRLQNRLAYARTDIDRSNHNPDFTLDPASYRAKGDNERWEYQGSFAATNQLNATFGLEHEQQKMWTRSVSEWAPAPQYEAGTADLNSAYGQIQWTVRPGLTLTGGLRYDDHSEYGDDLVGQLAGVWALNQGRTLVRASWGQGFRAPGPYELYSQYGNLALEPERFDSWEIGLEQRLSDDVRVSATYFLREADNEIDYQNCSFGTTDPLCLLPVGQRFGYYRNLNQTRTQGLELIAQARLMHRLNLNANYSWTEAQSAGGATDGKRLVRRPEHLANLSLDYDWSGGLKTGLSLRYVGDSFANVQNTQVTEAYSLVDLRASYPVNDQMELYGRIENLFDEDYVTVPGYSTAGQAAYGGVRLRF